MATLALSGIHVLLVMVVLHLQMHVSFKGDARSLPPGEAVEAQEAEAWVMVEVPLAGPGGAAAGPKENHRHALVNVHKKEEMFHHFRTLATFVDYAEPQPNKSHGTKGKPNSHIDIEPPR